MKATQKEIEELLASHKISPVEIAGTSSAQAAGGGRPASLSIVRREEGAVLSFTIGDVLAQSLPPRDISEARRIVSKLRAEARLPEDASFEHMLAELLVRISDMFEDSGATKLEFESLRLHPSSYHIGKVTLLHDKPLHLKARLEPDSHDRGAVFSHRHGDRTRFPK